jgi:hypothetical protein
MTFDCIPSKDRWLNWNCKCDYGIISINILLLPIKWLGKVAAVGWVYYK